MVKIESLSFSYKKEFPLFLNFSWNIARGERWSLIGPSGCGKTTLLYLLAGLRSPSSGQISIDGQASGGKISAGLILQDYGLLPWATAVENIALGLKIQGTPEKLAGQIAHQWLADLGLESEARHYPAELSGGQRQRVAIARTLALRPPLILMDEPFASLDTLTREELLDLVLRLWSEHQSTIIMVTHNIEDAVYWGKRILVMGPPPHDRPVIVENPGSGSPGFRQSGEFYLRCGHLRAQVEKNPPALKIRMPNHE
jgi:NitT/TauT family transport system ATP-binding protein